MAKNLINLDQLRAESQKVQFLGKEFEVGYIPSGLSIPLLENHNQMIAEQKEDDSQAKLFNDNIKSVSVFCSFYEPEFTEDYIRKNATGDQVVIMYELILQAILINVSKADLKNEAEDNSQKKTTGQK